MNRVSWRSAARGGGVLVKVYPTPSLPSEKPSFIFGPTFSTVPSCQYLDALRVPL